MPAGAFLRSGQRLVPLFLAVTLVPSALLVALGWLLFEQDRDGATRHIDQRRGEAADVVVSELRTELAGVEQALADPARRFDLAVAPDAVVVVFSANAVDARPGGRLAYLPVASTEREADRTVFVAGEDLERRQLRPDRAAAWFRARAASTDPAIRAGALIRLARNLRKTGEADGALKAYEQASGIQGVAVAGAPVGLLA